MGETVFITDYIGGQDPILILNDLNQTQDSSRFTNRLTSDFPSENNSFTIKYLEDAVVIAENSETCEQVIADYKLGKTIALDEKARAQIFQNLPRSVSERLVKKDESYSKSIYKGRLMETHTGTPPITYVPSIASSSTMTCGFDIKDFYALPGNGNVIVLGKKGELVRFKNQKSYWKKDLQEKVLGEIQLIDLHGTGENFTLLNTANEIHLWNVDGQYETGFPIQLEAEATNEIKFYRWKGNSYFLIADINNKVVHFDSKGRELNMISSGMEISRQIDVWASQKRLFIGFANNQTFKMYDMKKKRIHREFPINSKAYPIKVPNQLFQFSMSNDHLVKYDQKGIKFEFDSYKSAKILNIQPDKSNPVIILQSLNEIHLINSEGISFSHIKLPFNEIEDVHINTAESGKTFIAIIDGLENNVYLYRTDGQLVVKKSLEGQSKVRLSTLNNQKQITTIVDQFVTQYLED